MFSNLNRGSALHGADKSGEKWVWFTGTVERITPSISSPYNPYSGSYGQIPRVSLDIVATIDGKQREFKGIHGDDTIADFGDNTVILADSENTLYNHVGTLLKTSEEAVDENNIAWHRKRIPCLKDFLSQMRPSTAQNSEVKELKEQVGSLQQQLAEALSLLKKNTSKTEE